MKEIEVKVLEINPEDIRKKLLKIGAKLVKKEFQTNLMFDFPDKRFFSSGGYVRIRLIKKLNSDNQDLTKGLITFKELISRDKFKVSQEIEFNSDNPEQTKEFLQALGLKLFRTDEKLRESYKLPEGLIEIDTWAGVPPYLEAEAESEEKVIKLLESIDFSLEQSTSMTLAEIMRHYQLGNSDCIFSEKEKRKIFENK